MQIGGPSSAPRPLRLSPERGTATRLWPDEFSEGSSDNEDFFAAVIRPSGCQESEGASCSRPVQNADGATVDLSDLRLNDVMLAEDDGWTAPQRRLRIRAAQRRPYIDGAIIRYRFKELRRAGLLDGRTIEDLTPDDIFPLPPDAPETPPEGDEDEPVL